ncbi:MAG: ATP-binding protein [Caldilineaceae bacterium]|nr:ATP-binding protein [Caldilineaceae bacterium]
MTPRPAVLVITGAPAAGKTTLARRLSQSLSWPLISKDDIKETLFETLGWSDDEAWAKQLGIASWHLLYQHAEQLAAAGVSFVTESNFEARFADQRWLDLQERIPLRIVQLLCWADDELMRARYRGRIADGSRHPGHVDRMHTDEYNPAALRSQFTFLNLPGAQRAVDTGTLGTDEYEALLSWLQDQL